jgi:hypothetical protein
MVTLLTILGPAGRRSARGPCPQPASEAEGHCHWQSSPRSRFARLRRSRGLGASRGSTARRGKECSARASHRPPARGHGAINFKFWKGLGGRGEA